MLDAARSDPAAGTADREGSRRTRRIVRAVIVALTVLVLAASSLAIWANAERLQAIHELDVASSDQLITQSELIGNTNPVVSKLLSIAASRINPSSSEARYAILSAAALTGIAVLSGSGGSANSVAFSPDGKILASGNQDGTVGLWNVSTHRQVGTILTSHISPVESVAFSPDGRVLASASGGTVGAGTVQLWDVATRQQIGSPLTGGSGGVTSVAFSPDGTTLACGGTRLMVWKIRRS
jgi:WD40 repeat protein